MEIKASMTAQELGVLANVARELECRIAGYKNLWGGLRGVVPVPRNLLDSTSARFGSIRYCLETLAHQLEPRAYEELCSEVVLQLWSFWNDCSRFIASQNIFMFCMRGEGGILEGVIPTLLVIPANPFASSGEQSAQPLTGADTKFIRLCGQLTVQMRTPLQEGHMDLQLLNIIFQADYLEALLAMAARAVQALASPAPPA